MGTLAHPEPLYACPTIEMLEAGIPLDAIQEFSAESGLSVAAICDVVIPPRTLKHRRARREPLSRDESDKLVRLMRIYRFAVKVFGNPDKASRWLNRTRERFGNRNGIEMLRTEIGGRMVEELLGQIDEGMFA